MPEAPALNVVMYHYVREFRKTAFPEIKGMELEDFRDQVNRLRERFEMASVESSLAFVAGTYRPSRNLCLLTFDDGLKEHFDTVTPILADLGIQGVFFAVTSCLEDSRVAPVHMNHFLMAHLGIENYRQCFMDRVRCAAPDVARRLDENAEVARLTYNWDTDEVARFKYFFNFVMNAPLRDELVAALFAETFGSEEEFARQLYMSWEDARAMQQAGMALGGHTHTHRPLATMTPAEMSDDLSRCRELLHERLQPQPVWTFSYPYGKKSSFNEAATTQLKELRFDCAFSTETGSNRAGSDLFQLRRVDCKNALV